VQHDEQLSNFAFHFNLRRYNMVDEFAARVFQELNYVQEGMNAERFARLYGRVIYRPPRAFTRPLLSSS
jgi:predicted unusual protein kinase regulating ubiquinone biosynthesis (AarF/ABC1/UbiB family)